MKRPGQPRRTVGLPRGKSPKRSSLPARSSGIRRTPVKRSNPKRRAKNFGRCYGSEDRVRWIQSLPCLACDPFRPLGRSVNAHSVGGGKGRKADAKTIVPFCPQHHDDYDNHNPPFDSAERRDEVIAAAARIEALWVSLNRNPA